MQQTNNVLYEPLPTTWGGFCINTGFEIGVQLTLCLEDKELSDDDKMAYAIMLLFGDENGDVWEIPDDFEECIQWFLGGWNHDKSQEQEKNERVMDFYVDQGRIYADFRQIYGINLNDCDLHWWEFCWLLWNMPHKKSSFLQVIEIRTKKPSKNASNEEVKAIREAQKIYRLEQPEKEFSEDEISAIDGFDAFMKNAKSKDDESAVN